MKKRVRTLLLLFLCAAMVFLCSCGNGGAPYSVEEAQNRKASYSDADLGKVDPADPMDAGRKIIKTVNETLETTAFDETIASLRAAVSAAGGYFAESSYSGGEGERHTASFTVRVPADRLDAFGTAVENAGTVTSYREGTEDVTMAYVDVESRIAVLEAEEAALLAILGKTEDISSMLAVRSQLNGVQQDLASYRAQKEKYDDLVSYSTVYLYVREVLRVQKTEQNFFEQVGTTFLDSLAGVGAFFRGLGVGIFGGLPYIVLVGAIASGIVFLCRAILRRKRNKKQ